MVASSYTHGARRLVAGLILTTWAGPALAILNGTFDAGLSEWTTDGNVSVVAAEARLADDSASRSILYQGVFYAPASFQLDFDFRNQLSANVPLGAFPDSFFASVYFINDLSNFDPLLGQFDAVVDLLDLDHTGVSNLNGTITSSPKGPEWLHFTGIFPNSYTYVIPTFEFFNLNGISGDSQVLVDNVFLIIPEPSTLMIGLSGLMTLGLLHWRRRCVSEM